MKQNPNYYSILTANVRYDNELTDSEKILFSEITALADRSGYCWASNKYFSELFDVTKKTISRRITNLVKRNYLKRELVEGENGRIEKRKLIPLDNKKEGCGHLRGEGMDTNVQENNTSINNTSTNNNNIVPKEEIEKIYEDLPPYWEQLFKDYIDIYRSKNQTNKITDNKHLRLLKEIKGIFDKMKFGYNKSNYELTEKIFEKGIIKIIEKGVDNLNYAKKVWISSIEKRNKRGNNNGQKQICQSNGEEKEETGEDIFDFNTG